MMMQKCDSVFNSTCVGSIALAIFITLLQGLCGMSFGKFALPQFDLIEYSILPPVQSFYLCLFFLGVLISTICDQETSAIHMALGSFYPNILCSGVLWPIEGMPIFLRKLVYFLPQAYTIDSLRCVLSRGKKKHFLK